MKFSYKALIAGSLMTLSAAAVAMPIEGDIAFGATFDAYDFEGGSKVSLDEATFIDIIGNQANVFASSDDLAGLTGTAVTYNDFYIDGTDLPYSPLWSGGGFSFALETINIVSQTAVEIGLSGAGTMSAEGYEDTSYFWSWSGDTSGGTFNAFSSTNTPVPEPGTLALLGLGLAGLGAARRRQKAA